MPSPHGRSRAHAAAAVLLTLALAVGLTAGLTWGSGSAPAHAAGQAAGEVTGIDVSRFQHPGGAAIDWTAVKGDGHAFVFVKATEGTTYLDPHYHSDITDAAAVGLYRGAYHVALPVNSSGTAQAEHYVATVGRLRQAGDLPPVLDFEAKYAGDLTPTQLVTWAKAWLSTAERLTGRVPIIYTSPDFWKTRMGGSTAFGRYPLWLAHYTTGSPSVPASWTPGTGWTFWQHTDQGAVSGIDHRVDLNRFDGSLEELAALATPPPVPTPQPPVPVVVSTALTLSADKTRIRRGQPVRLNGRLTGDGRALPGRTVQVLQRAAGAKRWSVVRRVRTTTAGRLVVALRPRRTTAYRVTFTASQGYAASASRAVRVRVR